MTPFPNSLIKLINMPHSPMLCRGLFFVLFFYLDIHIAINPITIIDGLQNTSTMSHDEISDIISNTFSQVME